jgi:hypothetical protein
MLSGTPSTYVSVERFTVMAMKLRFFRQAETEQYRLGIIDT